MSTILLIDDEQSVRSIFSMFLHMKNFEVIEAPDGESGVSLFENRRPDLALVDLYLPGINGIEVIRKMKQIDPLFPTVVVSATRDIQDSLKAIEAGAWDFVTKPVSNLEELAFVIHKTLDKARLLEENERYKQHLEAEVEKKSRDLIESEKRYRAVFENAGEGIFIISQHDWRIKYANPAFCHITGYGIDELLSADLKTIFPNLITPLVSDSSPLTENDTDIQFRYKNGALGYADLRFSQVVIDGENCGLCIFNDRTERKINEQKIQRYQEQLKDFVFELSKVEERERHQLANELHDTIVQNLALTKLNLEQLKKGIDTEKDKNLLSRTIELLEESIRQSRSMMFELSPPLLYDLGIGAGLEWLVEQFRRQNNIHIELEKSDTIPRMHMDTEILLFKSVRELMINAIKHSRASKIRLELLHKDRLLVISVEDNGKGFDPEQIKPVVNTRGGFGLFSIQERLPFIGADMSIMSRPGQGTQITLTIPLDSLSQEDNHGH